MLQPCIKQVVKKLSTKGKGLFKVKHITNDFISFTGYGNNLFSFQITNHPYKGCGTFAAGHLTEWTDQGLTYESEYTRIGDIERAKFTPYHISNTDNPEYIVKNAVYFILGN